MSTFLIVAFSDAALLIPANSFAIAFATVAFTVRFESDSTAVPFKFATPFMADFLPVMSKSINLRCSVALSVTVFPISRCNKNRLSVTYDCATIVGKFLTETEPVP